MSPLRRRMPGLLISPKRTHRGGSKLVEYGVTSTSSSAVLEVVAGGFRCLWFRGRPVVDGIRSLRSRGAPRCWYTFAVPWLLWFSRAVYWIGLPRSGLDSRLAEVLARVFSSLKLSRQVNLVDC